jgi:uncharacterized protein YbjQ (UPF0145 family)
MVMGSCAYSVMFSGMPVWSRQRWQNVELPGWTQSMYDARELAMGRMQAEAQALHANGVVGVELREHEHGWGGRIIEFFAVGTAIVTDEKAAKLPSPSPVIDLSG